MIDIAPITEQPLFSVKEAIKLLGVSESTVRRMIRSGELKSQKVRGSRRIFRASLVQYTSEVVSNN
jgi:excisionase family DNA binding protein